MEILRLKKFSLLSILLLLSITSWRVTATSDNLHGDFLQCLLSYSQPSHPISQAIFTPKNSSYSSVLQAYIRNLRFNTTSTPKPLLIITALHESHIQTAIICARKHGLQMKIRSGGHNYEGISYVSETGATLGELYYRISEKSKTHGFPAGVCPTVGVGGHFGGGGYGNMMRKYGLTVDHIVDAKLIDVNGRFLDRKSMVTVFRVRRTLEENATEIVDQWQHVVERLPQELFIRLGLDVVNSTQTGKKTVRATFISLFLGDSHKLLSIMNESLPKLGLVQSDCIETSWVQSVLFWTHFPVGTPEEILLDRTPQSLTFYKIKSDYVKKPIPKDGLDFIWKRMIELERPTMAFNPYGGRMAEIPSTAVPFPHRAGNIWKIQYSADWNEPGDDAANRYINATRKLYNYMTPFVSKNPREAFFNYIDLDLAINHNGKDSYVEGKAYGIKYFLGNFNR
ncbi:reticuline oxidase-like protein [Melia azedarach]|uniref:Reticuline oxidase-like protein n=1 Tax=Melia azedarach TaxID=155640 RepID=A0ACC1WUR7_MELAZ|nr:reticuline oxidase-like protein [Melia azedarach]